MHTKITVLESRLNKVAGLHRCNFVENFELYRIFIYFEICERLLQIILLRQ